jgi:sulfite exporter TauE/SafE
VISKAENWSRKETLLVTAITGGAHTISTILIGIIVGLVGYKLSSTYEFVTKIVAPIILIFIGLIYLIIGFNNSHHSHNHVEIDSASKRSKFIIIISLGMAMFFSPCIEIEAYYFTAGTLGMSGIITVSIIYLIMTILA